MTIYVLLLHYFLPVATYGYLPSDLMEQGRAQACAPCAPEQSLHFFGAPKYLAH